MYYDIKVFFYKNVNSVIVLKTEFKKKLYMMIESDSVGVKVSHSDQRYLLIVINY